jgi:hypothetical protein
VIACSESRCVLSASSSSRSQQFSRRCCGRTSTQARTRPSFISREAHTDVVSGMTRHVFRHRARANSTPVVPLRTTGIRRLRRYVRVRPRWRRQLHRRIRPSAPLSCSNPSTCSPSGFRPPEEVAGEYLDPGTRVRSQEMREILLSRIRSHRQSASGGVRASSPSPTPSSRK